MTASVDLSAAQVEFHPLSFFDEKSRVFSWEGRLYRTIDPDRGDVYHTAFASGLVDELVEGRLLVDTKLAPLTLDGRPVVEHRELPTVSYPFEWCPEMLRDAALATLTLERRLERDGLMLQDAHPFNIVFDGTTPLWVDFGALVPPTDDGLWGARNEFVAFFLDPLRLIAAGRGRVARWLLHDDYLGVLPDEAEAILASPLDQWSQSARRRVPDSIRTALRPARRLLAKQRSTQAKDGSGVLDSLESAIRGLVLPTPPGVWSDYYDDSFPPFEESDEWNTKHRTVNDVLERMRPATVLDVGANRGWYSLLAAKRGSTVVAIDQDERALTALYVYAKANGLPVQALVADFRRLSLGYGPGVAFLAPAHERLRVDLVLGLAISHHLVFGSRLDFDRIAEAFAAFSRHALLAEFIPAEDEHVSLWHPETRPWYTLDNFVASLRKQFSSVEVLPSYPEPRVLVLCRRSA